MLTDDEALLMDLQAAFPAAFPEGKLDRRALGRIVFQDDAKLERLNAVTHPHIRRRILEQLKELEACGTALAVLDAPTLLKAGRIVPVILRSASRLIPNYVPHVLWHATDWTENMHAFV